MSDVQLTIVQHDSIVYEKETSHRGKKVNVKFEIRDREKETTV